MTSDIQKNLVYLTENLVNLQTVLIHLVQNGIISPDEKERIANGETNLDLNDRCCSTLDKNDWNKNKKLVLKILRKTNNEHCAEEIERNHTEKPARNKSSLVLEEKWWPAEKFLPKAFQERKMTDLSLVEYLKAAITHSRNTSTVISQGAAVSGLGGVGKTTTAIWFAQHFQTSYDHIIWIDCGEGSLISSFRSLVLKLKINTEFELTLLAKECFTKLQNVACLCIFDNAECYQGIQGIRKVFPNIPNIHCIITSRNTLWGSETGDGRIQQIHLNAFDYLDGINFLKCYLKDQPANSEEKMKELSELLGNLPLALQIAIRAINNKKITLDDYIHRIKTTSHIINQSFDGYEKTINQTMKISLDIIQCHESDHSQIAYNVLLIFGYIRPDHVELKFFEAVENVSTYELDEAIDLLQSYSLVTGFSDCASIHRLLQQVIRHNCRATEKPLICKILSCKDFFDYKLIPFSFADEELQNQFPILRSHLKDQPLLQKLLCDRKFTEAVKLSLLIKSAMNFFTADFNHAVCLEKGGYFDQAIIVLQTIYAEMRKDVNQYSGYFGGRNLEAFGLINLDGELSFREVCGLLFLIYLKSGNTQEASKLITEEKALAVSNNVDSVINFVRCAKPFSSTLKYNIQIIGDWSHLELHDTLPGNSLCISNCCFSEKLPRDLHQLELRNAEFVSEDGHPFAKYDVTDIISPSLKKLMLINTKGKTIFSFDGNSSSGHIMESICLSGPQVLVIEKCLWNVKELILSSIEIPLIIAKKTEMKISRLRLGCLSVSLTSLFNLSHSVEQIELTDVNFFDDMVNPINIKLKLDANKILITSSKKCTRSVSGSVNGPCVLINNIIRIETINELTLEDYYRNYNDLVLDLNEISVMEKLRLTRVKIINLESANCFIKELRLYNIDISSYNQTNLRAKILVLDESAIQLNVLVQICEQSIELEIYNGEIILPVKHSTDTNLPYKQVNTPKVTLHRVTFVTSFGKKIKKISANKIINMDRLTELTLNQVEESQLTLKMNGQAQLQRISFAGVKLLHFYECEWNVDQMELHGFNIMKNMNTQISSLTLYYSQIDLCFLPVDIQKIDLQSCNVTCSTRLNLPKLNFLKLPFDFSNLLKHFVNCFKLTSIEFYNPYLRQLSSAEIDVSAIPKFLRTMTFSNISYPTSCVVDIISKRSTQLDTLVLQGFEFRHLELILSNCSAENVVFNRSGRTSLHELSVVSELLEKTTTKVSIKRIICVPRFPFMIFNDASFSIPNNKITILEEKEFDKLVLEVLNQ